MMLSRDSFQNLTGGHPLKIVRRKLTVSNTCKFYFLTEQCLKELYVRCIKLKSETENKAEEQDNEFPTTFCQAALLCFSWSSHSMVLCLDIWHFSEH